jgi:diguanylate cyclase (GGDEF)-like protein
LLLILAVSLAGAAALEKVSVQLDWKYQFEYAGYIAAKEKDFYKNAGLEVELREYTQGTDVVSDVLNGKTNYGIYNSSIVIDNGKIKPIVVMATYLQHSPLVLIARKGLDNPAGLIGKTIMGTKNELKHSSLSLLLSHFEITSQNTTFVDQTFSIDPFISGKVDAMSAYRSNQLYLLDQMRIPYEIIDPVEYGFIMNAGNLFTSQQEAINHPERTQKFIDATNLGWKYATEHPGEMIDILIRKYHVKKSHEALAYEAKVIKKLMMTDFYAVGETNSETTTRLYKQLIRAGAIREDQKLGQFLFRDVVASSKNKFQLSEAEKNYLSNKKKITMCVDPEWYPLEAIRDGQHIGIASDVIKSFSTKLGVPIELIPTTSWNQSLVEAKNRRCDILSMASKTPEREKYMDFSPTYLALPYVLVTTMDKPFIEHIDHLQGKTIGIVKGYEIFGRLKKRYPNLTIVEVDSIRDGLKKVENGQLYGYIDNLIVSTSYIQKEYIGSLKVSSRLEEQDELRVAMRNDEPILGTIFDKLVKQLDDASMQKIYNRWVSTIEQVAWIDHAFVWKVLIFLLIGIVAFTWRYFLLKRYSTKLLELSITDKLTGLYNRQKTDEKLSEEQRKVERYPSYHCSIMMIDVDFFKSVNDRYGHQTGDRILQEVAAILQQKIRQTDVIGRWGGEEFMIILPHTPIENADAVAENLRHTVEQHSFELEQPITISIGIGQLKKSHTVHEMIGDIDSALYDAKKCGRNCVSHAN